MAMVLESIRNMKSGAVENNRPLFVQLALLKLRTRLDTHTSTTGGGVLFISASQALVSLILLGIYEGKEARIIAMLCVLSPGQSSQAVPTVCRRLQGALLWDSSWRLCRRDASSRCVGHSLLFGLCNCQEGRLLSKPWWVQWQ